MKRFATAFALLLFGSALASANWSVGPAFQIFSGWGVLAYAVVIVISEAAIIGKSCSMSAFKSLAISLVANFTTAFISLVIAVPTIRMITIGDDLNPNPLFTALVLLISFAMPSALVESLFWICFCKSLPKSRFTLCSIGAHVICIPLGLVVLLVPPHPYHGLEYITLQYRRVHALSMLRAEEVKAAERNSLLPASSAEDFMVKASREAQMRGHVDYWAAAYMPDFDRLDMGEQKRKPLQWNQSAQAQLNALHGDGKVWLMRYRDSKMTYGYVVDVSNYRITPSSTPRELGY